MYILLYIASEKQYHCQSEMFVWLLDIQAFGTVRLKLHHFTFELIEILFLKKNPLLSRVCSKNGESLEFMQINFLSLFTI